MRTIDKADPYGWGLSLFTDFSVNLGHSSGKRRVIEAIIGRLVDDLWFDENYGADLPQRLKRYRKGVGSITQIEQICQSKIMQDDRISSVKVTINIMEENAQVTIAGTLAQADEPFELIGNISLIEGNDFSFNN